MTLPIRVECYSGWKADERPVRFRLDERDYFVEQIMDQWYGPDGAFFRVGADDGRVYLLRHDTAADQWMLEVARQP